MRAFTHALLGLCCIGSACVIRPSSGTGSDVPQNDPNTRNTIASAPTGDPCAAYIERSAPNVRCQAIDATRCQCELVQAPPQDPQPTSTPVATAPNNPPPAGDATATLEFAPGPPNTIVQCVSGPCPTRSADFITTAYPPIPIPTAGATIQLEFRAPGYKPYVGTYNLVPGRNAIQFNLEHEFGSPTAAVFHFQGAPPGTTVQCVSGPCADTKAYPIEKFPELPLKEDGGMLLLRFNAPGYRTATTSFQVRRGPNVVPVLMEKAPLGK